MSIHSLLKVIWEAQWIQKLSHISTSSPHYAHLWKLLDDEFTNIMDRYSEPRRKYHTQYHLYEIFSNIDKYRDEIISHFAVTMALFYHDIVYDPQSSSNEEDSSKHVETFFQQLMEVDCTIVSQHDVLQITTFIMATVSHAIPSPIVSHEDMKMICSPHDQQKEDDLVKAWQNDLMIVLDLDLSILSMPYSRVEEYDHQIRDEYSFVEESDFIKRRGDILFMFYNRSSLYFHPISLHNQLCSLAKSNIQSLLVNRYGFSSSQFV